ncbi:helix-turn-helix transcriptional regulator [Pseudonocardia zijingensis]|uniref:helix-turn-helix transcriptional regulator n=1 Tax=Pseudonocardia zijingensis TaxID=153376 RepID=UPI0031DE4808
MPEQLGEFLRSRRERLSPEAVGLPLRRRRRTPGLRREEVAELAGIGVDWYVRLEQGRPVHPSPQTVEALARALRLDDTDRRHLRALADAGMPPAFRRETVPDGLRAVVETLERPAYVTGRRWDLLVWNAAAAELFGDFHAKPEDDRNILVYLLLDPAARALFGAGWAEVARHAVAQFRAVHDLAAPDPAFTDLSARLRDGCPELAGWWDEHRVAAPGSGRKLLHLPGGPVAYEYVTLQATDDPALRLSVYSRSVAPVPGADSFRTRSG